MSGPTTRVVVVVGGVVVVVVAGDELASGRAGAFGCEGALVVLVLCGVVVVGAVVVVLPFFMKITVT